MSALALMALFGAQLAANVPDGLRCLHAAYPDSICGATATSVVLCDGTALAWEDGVDHADHARRLAAPDLADMMRQRYVAGPTAEPPPVGHDPGRVRNDALMRALWGADKRAVRDALAPVRWLPDDGGATVMMTRRHGVDRALQRVSDDIAREVPAPIRAQVATASGTFVWRTIRGTDRRSAHSWGIAIDVGVKISDYWRWTKPDAAGRYRFKNRFPIQVARIFERQGFIWGGRWYHFDTMHFEYRPELLTPPCGARPGATP